MMKNKGDIKMKNVFVVEFKIFDGEDENNFVEIFKTYDSAKRYLKELKEDYKEFWEDFDTINDEEDYFVAFNKEWYDNANIEINIEEKEIN